MWRAFFFAIGANLILLGAQCLVVETYYLTENSRITQFFARAMNVASDSVNSGLAAGSASSTPTGGNLRSANPNFANTSSFGPSRFQTNPFDRSNQAPFIQGNRSSENSLNPPFRFTGYSQPASNNPSSAAGPIGARMVRTRDWMPWSLLAAGAIVVLYTNVSTRRFSNDP